MFTETEVCRDLVFSRTAKAKLSPRKSRNYTGENFIIDGKSADEHRNPGESRIKRKQN